MEPSPLPPLPEAPREKKTRALKQRRDPQTDRSLRASMGKREAVSRKLDSWFGRGFKATKLRSCLNLTSSRLAILRNQSRTRLEQARGDVAQLLRQGQRERAVHRAEFIIKEQNMLDAFDMIEGYCQILSLRADLLERQSGCPEELREALSGLMYAESRCGQLYELHKVRSIIGSRLGKDFVSSAVEHPNTGVNPTIIQNLSTKKPGSEMLTKAAKDVGAELGIDLQLKNTPLQISTDIDENSLGAKTLDILSDPMKLKGKYKNAEEAAMEAFQSAAYAAAAAKEAVELSRSESQSHGGGSSGPSTPMEKTRSVRRTNSSGSDPCSGRELESPSSSKSEDFPWKREKPKGCELGFGERNSDGGGGKLKSVLDLEDEEIEKGRKLVFLERQREDSPKLGLKKWKEEEEEEVENGTLKEEEKVRGGATLTQKLHGMERKPVSMRTRRSAF